MWQMVHSLLINWVSVILYIPHAIPRMPLGLKVHAVQVSLVHLSAKFAREHSLFIHGWQHIFLELKIKPKIAFRT